MTAAHHRSGPSTGAHTLQGADADAAATELARKVLAGEAEEFDARWQIAVIAEGLDEIDTVARTYVFKWRGSQTRIDIADRLRDLIARKVVGTRALPATADRPATPAVAPALDLQRIADGSTLSGWVWAFAKAAAPSEMRGLDRARQYCLPTDFTHETSAADGFAVPDMLLREAVSSMEVVPDVADHVTDAFDSGVPLPDTRLGSASLLAAGHRTRVEDAADSYLRRSAGMRELGKVHEQGRALRQGLGVSAVDRAAATLRREALRTIINEDPTAAHRAVRAAAGAAPAAKPDSGEQMLTRLWSGHDRRDLLRLAELDPRVSHALVLEATTPKPPPQVRAVAQVRAQVKAAVAMAGAIEPSPIPDPASMMFVGVDGIDLVPVPPARAPRRGPSRVTLAARVVDAYVAHISETTCSEFAGNAAEKDLATMRNDRLAFDAAAKMLTDSGFRALGESPQQVAARLDDLFESVTEELTSVCA